jgi:hypothetical protein
MTSAALVDYEFDAFISYSHSPLIKPWVNDFFHKYLKDWLDQKMGGQSARIFIDNEEIKPGQRWPQRLRDALLTSKCLVPVYSGDYFFKEWCFSEWSNFVERENVLGIDNSANSLIVPILHNDGEWFPDKAKEYQMFDFKNCQSTLGNFQNHPRFHIFEDKMERFAEAVKEAIKRAPEFDPAWPIVEFDPKKRIVPLMRIS